MCFLYVVEHGTVLGIDGGSVTVKNRKETIDRIPMNTIEGISLFSKTSLTAECSERCLKLGIPVSRFDSTGRYLGGLFSCRSGNAKRIRQQIAMADNESFSLELSKRIISAKINNQIVVAKRYLKSRNYPDDDLKMLRVASKKIDRVSSHRRVRGFEGIASRYYFNILGEVIEPDFRFTKRSRRPSTDPFNCMINFGYSLLTKEITGELENRGLNPYIAFMHEDKRNHPSLASDMVEEWRPVIVDSVMMGLVQGHEISSDHFFIDGSGCRFTNEGFKIVIRKMEARMAQKVRYLDYFSTPISFREALWHQADRLSRAIDKGDPTLYQPVRIR